MEIIHRIEDYDINEQLLLPGPRICPKNNGEKSVKSV